MDLRKELVRGIYHYGYEYPSAIQQRAVLPIIKGKASNASDMQTAHRLLS